jgi:hypothetical protein
MIVQSPIFSVSFVEYVMRASSFFAVLVISAVIAGGCRTVSPQSDSASGLAEAPTGDNNLNWWGLDAIKYDDMPMEAKLSKLPWPSDYWATMHGGISFRWQTMANSGSEDYKDYIYAIPDQTAYETMPVDELNKLSPSEKYDLWLDRKDLKDVKSATGRQRDFMLTSAKWNNENLGEDKIPSWTGICNGWSLAAIYEAYPAKSVVKKLADGREITFYSSDIAALISQIYFDYQPAINVARLGAMCEEPVPAVNSRGRRKNAACRDVNPMSFHIALGRYLAADKPFVFDVEPGQETWNQPVYSYKMELKNKRKKPSSYLNAAPGTVEVIDAEVTLEYIKEARPSTVGITPDNMKRYIASEDYKYTLELDAAGKILGGEWKKNSPIPDFLWRPDEKPSDAILQRAAPDYPLSYDKVKELIDLASAP